MQNLQVCITDIRLQLNFMAWIFTLSIVKPIVIKLFIVVIIESAVDES